MAWNGFDIFCLVDNSALLGSMICSVESAFCFFTQFTAAKAFKNFCNISDKFNITRAGHFRYK
jgi:hypothetical protein